MDTSVVVKWYAPEKETDFGVAERVFYDLGEGKIIVKTSGLLIHELANALLKGKKLTEEKMVDSLKLFFQTKVEVVPTDLSLIKSAISLAIKYDLTVYDAVYVALAKKFGCQLISANPKCHGKVKDGTSFAP